MATLGFVLPVLIAAGCSDPAPAGYQGFVEGEFVFVASPYAGTLQGLAVARGQTVRAGAPLFELEHAGETAAVAEAKAMLSTAEARLPNLEAGRRKPELDALRAQVASASTAREQVR